MPNSARTEARPRIRQIPSAVQLTPVWIALYAMLTAAVWLPPLYRAVTGS